jgi:ATP-dependent DNA helicase RecQ
MTISSAPASKRSRSADPILEAARRHFAIPYLYPIQRFVISNTLEEKNQIVVLPTGAGKSLCYQLPARLGRGLTIVVVPLLSLLEDQLRRCRNAGLRARSVRGGQSRGERRGVIGEACSGQIDLLFVTPETLSRLRQDQSLQSAEIDHLVVDEAHCVCEWGETFRPAYLELGELLRGLNPRCLTAFTATAGPRVLKKVQEVVFQDREVTILSADPDRPNIRYSVIPTLSKTRTLLQLAQESPRPLLIFIRSRSGAERAARTLRRRMPRLETFFYHAGLNREERSRIEAWFKPSREGVLAATSAYGLGVDKLDIRTVVHLDIPYSPEAYLQETGRAGRDGRSVAATLLYGPEDLEFAGARGAETADPLAAERYAQMLGYALETARCRREQLLSFLGQEPGSCSGCDVCGGRASHCAEGEREILDFFFRNPRRFTRLQAVKVLRGVRSYEVSRRDLGSYYGYGLLSGWQEEEEIEEALEALIRWAKVRVLKRGPWKERIAPVNRSTQWGRFGQSRIRRKDGSLADRWVAERSAADRSAARD